MFRPSKLRLSLIANLLLTLVSFVLIAITLFAGQHAGPLEDYAVMRVNTSRVTHVIIHNGVNKVADALSANSNDDDDEPPTHGLFNYLPSNAKSWLQDLHTNITAAITDGIDNYADKLADEAKNSIGISDWYSLHVLDTCQGEYTPNATVSDPQRHTVNCSSSVNDRFNLTNILGHEFKIGGKEVSLNDLDWTGSIQDEIDSLNTDLVALVVLISIAMGLTGLALFSTSCSIAWPDKRSLILVNLLVTSVATCIVLGASISVTVAGSKAMHRLNRTGEKFGINASRGHKFLGIIWAAAAVNMIVSVVWHVVYIMAKRRARRDEIVKYSAKQWESR